MMTTRALEHARNPDDVVVATATCLRFWSREELSRIVTGAELPRVDSVEDIEEWADRLERQARDLPLLEPDETSREQLVRLFLLASVKLRLLARVARPAACIVPLPSPARSLPAAFAD